MNTRGLAAAAVVAIAGALLLTGGVASAAPEPPVIVVCGYDNGGYTLNTVPGGCQDIDTAISDASVSATPTTIEMMPGDYCPFTIGYGIQPLTIVGVGAAGINGGAFTGPEAALTSVNWDSTACSGITNGGAEINLPDGRYQGAGINPATVTLQNITIDGSPTPGSGPTAGLFAQEAGNLVLRDAIFENSGATQLRYDVPNGDTTDSVTVDNSAFVHGGLAVWADSAELRSEPVAVINETTIDNAATGLEPDNSNVTLTNVTIANGGIGVDVADTSSQVNASNTIVGDNSADCDPNDAQHDFVWEAPFGGSSTNLTGSTCPKNVGSDSALTNSVASSADNGGPTPSILPPAQAVGAGLKANCNSTGTDQREYTYTAGTACDIGAVDSTATSNPAAGSASPSSHDFMTVAQGVQDQLAVTLTNTGGGQLGVSGVAFSAGTSDYSITKDLCTFDLLVNAGGQSCEVDVEFAPSVAGTDDGTLTFDTTAGSVDVTFTGVGGPLADPPNKPTGVTANAGNGFADLDWSQPAVAANVATVTGYDVQYSDDGGITWTAAPSAGTSGAAATSTSVTGLTNGQSYVLQVRATSTVGPGDWSNSSNSVTPGLPPPPPDNTRLTAPRAATINYGKTAVVSGTLTDTTTSAPLSGATVSLRARLGSSGPFTVVTSKSTANTGIVSVTMKPKANTQYEWTYAGDSSHHAATSSSATIRVAQVVTAALKPGKVKHRHKIAVYGSVTPNANGKTVVLQRLVAGKWRKVGRIATIHKQKLPNGKTIVGYVLHYKPAKKGTVSLRVSRAATATNTAGVSPTKKLKVT